MTFGQNKRYYTESSMKLSDPGALTVDYTRCMTRRHRLSRRRPSASSRSGSAAAAPSPISMRRCPTPRSSRSRSTRTWSISPRNTSSSRRPARLRAVVADGRSFLMRDNDKLGHHPDRRLSRAVRAVPPPDQGVLHAGQVAAHAGRGGGAEHRAFDHAVRFRDRDAATACFPRSISMTAAATWSRSAMTGRRCGRRNCWRAPPRCRSATICATTCARIVAGRRVLSRPTGKILTDDFAPVETMRAIEQNNEKWKEQTEAPR